MPVSEGPWTIAYLANGWPHTILAADGTAVGQVYTFGSEQMYDNADLMAAAPELRDELEWLLAEYSNAMVSRFYEGSIATDEHIRHTQVLLDRLRG